MKKATPRIDDLAAEWHATHFRTLNAGLEFACNMLPDFYRHCLHELHGRFTGSELRLILQALSGQVLSAGTSGQLYGKCTSAIDLDGLAKEWSVDRTSFLEALKSLRHFETVCLELWATGFWLSGAYQRDEGGAEWCRVLEAEQADVAKLR